MSSSAATARLLFGGDLMFGRLVNEVFPVSFGISEIIFQTPESKRDYEFAKLLMAQYGYSLPRDFMHPWGSTLSLIHSADLAAFNLECAITLHNEKFPHKAFNFRMHPANSQTLQFAKIKFLSLANNHIMDFKVEGMNETIQTLDKMKIYHAGAGLTKNNAESPAIIHIKPSISAAFFSFSDHGSGTLDRRTHKDVWATDSEDAPGVNIIDIEQILSSQENKDSFKKQFTAVDADMLVASIHWGPNYSWEPSREIHDFAHFLVDECKVSVVHGHSAHHVQGVEYRNGSLIIYGCGDALDDYEVSEEYKNNLSALFEVEVEKRQDFGVEIKKVQIHPIKCEAFQMNLIESEDEEFQWTVQKITILSENLGTMIKSKIIHDEQVEQEENSDIYDCFARSPQVEITVDLASE